MIRREFVCVRAKRGGKREREGERDNKNDRERKTFSATRHATLDRRTQTAFPAVTFARTSPLPHPNPRPTSASRISSPPHPVFRATLSFPLQLRDSPSFHSIRNAARTQHLETHHILLYLSSSFDLSAHAFFALLIFLADFPFHGSRLSLFCTVTRGAHWILMFSVE